VFPSAPDVSSGVALYIAAGVVAHAAPAEGCYLVRPVGWQIGADACKLQISFRFDTIASKRRDTPNFKLRSPTPQEPATRRCLQLGHSSGRAQALAAARFALPPVGGVRVKQRHPGNPPRTSHQGSCGERALQIRAGTHGALAARGRRRGGRATGHDIAPRVRKLQVRHLTPHAHCSRRPARHPANAPESFIIFHRALSCPAVCAHLWPSRARAPWRAAEPALSSSSTHSLVACAN
jgi:hypothetical protein